MTELPRGQGERYERPLATATWAGEEAYGYALDVANPAQVYCGAIVRPENVGRVMAYKRRCERAYARILDHPTLPLPVKTQLITLLYTRFRAVCAADALLLGVADDRHHVTIASSRAGKGTSLVIPILATYAGPMAINDPKGEITGLLATVLDQSGGQVLVLDFFGITQVPDKLRAGFNILCVLEPDSPTVIEDALLIASALVTIDSKDPHWSESARAFVAAVILYLVSLRAAMRTIPDLFMLQRLVARGDEKAFDRECARFAKDKDAYEEALKDYDQAATDYAAALARFETEGGELPTPPVEPEPPRPMRYQNAFDALVVEMSESPAFDGHVSAMVAQLRDAGDQERGSILSTARRNLEFLMTVNPHMKRALRSTFTFEVFKQTKPPVPGLPTPTGPARLFLVLPAHRLETHGRLLRMFFALLLQHMYSSLNPPVGGGLPLYVMMEEAATIGHLPIIETAVGYAAGFGVKLHFVFQDFSQIKRCFPKSWQSFLASAGVITTFASNDPETNEQLSKSLGECEVVRRTQTLSLSEGETTNSPSSQRNVLNAMSAVRPGPLQSIGPLAALLPDEDKSRNANRSSNAAEHLHIVPLLRPDEIGRYFAREEYNMIVQIRGQKPIAALRVPYYDDPRFVGRYVMSEAEKIRWATELASPPLPLDARDPERFARACADLEANLGELGV